jgi:hypothetical protein
MQMFTVQRRKPAVDAWSETTLPDTIHDFAIILYLALTTNSCLTYTVSCLDSRDKSRIENRLL